MVLGILESLIEMSRSQLWLFPMGVGGQVCSQMTAVDGLDTLSPTAYRSPLTWRAVLNWFDQALCEISLSSMTVPILVCGSWTVFEVSRLSLLGDKMTDFPILVSKWAAIADNDWPALAALTTCHLSASLSLLSDMHSKQRQDCLKLEFSQCGPLQWS